MDFGIRYGIVFLQEGLNKESMRDELSKIANIFEESEGTITNKNGQEVPVWVYFMDGSFGAYLKTKMTYNCESHNYMLFPRNPGETRSIFVN